MTLDVSKLSGWLNALADCRVERRVSDAQRGVAPGGVRAWGGGDASGMHGEAPRLKTGWARAERTRNMAYMLVTLDVSKLSGWLNADASCRA